MISTTEKEETKMVRDLKNDPTWQLAGRIAERVYIELGCSSVPVLQRAIDKALLEERTEKQEKRK